MGYKLTSLVHLPFRDSVELYVFSIGENLWEGGIQEIVHRNFDNIAREFGESAIMVEALTAEFHDEVVQKYLGKHHKELKNMMPAILITDAHPDHLTDKSMRAIFSLQRVYKVYPVIDKFLNDLASFARGESDSLLNQLERSVDILSVTKVFDISIPVVPGLVSVNIHNVINRLKDWWNKHKKHNLTNG